MRSPYDGELVGVATLGGPEIMDAAAEAAVRAQPAMAALTREARSRILERIADGIDARAEALARTVSRESGKPIAYARLEAARAADTFRASADAARALRGAEIPLDAARPGEGRLAFTRRFPVGPVASITPFNFPLNLVAHKVGPAIAAGCANLVKPASATPLSALALARIAHEAGVPAGGLGVVACDRKVGQRLVEDGAVPAPELHGERRGGVEDEARRGEEARGARARRQRGGDRARGRGRRPRRGPVRDGRLLPGRPVVHLGAARDRAPRRVRPPARRARRPRPRDALRRPRSRTRPSPAP